MSGLFKMPWWLKQYLRRMIKIDEKTAPRGKMILSVIYAFSALMAFNYVFIKVDKAGFTEEENRLLTEGEKTMIKLNIKQTKMMRYKSGEGWNSSDLTLDEVKNKLKEEKSAQSSEQLESEQTKE